MLYRVVFEGANLIKMSLVMAAAVLAICLLAFAGTAKKAEAGSLPQNGKIAFSRTTYSGESGIYAVDPDGSDLSLLTNKAGAPPAWSPDGTKIAFQHERSIWVTDPDGPNLRVLTTNKVDADDYRSYLAWSPDGTRIAFTRAKYGSSNSDIYTMDADGSDVTQVTNLPGYVNDLDWQPLTQKSRSMTVHQPDTGGPSLLWVAIALLFSGGVIFYAGLKRGV